MSKPGLISSRAWLGVLLASLVPGLVWGQEHASVARTEKAAVPAAHDRISNPLDQRVGFELHSVPFAVALEALTRSGIALVYPTELVAKGGIVSCDCDGVTGREALRQILDRTKLEYLILATGEVVLQAKPETRESRRQQTGMIRGRILDRATGLPLVGARVRVSGTTHNAISNEEGQYAIAGVPRGTYTLIANLVGYAEEQRTGVRVAGASAVTVNFDLRSEIFRLEELVVTGVIDPVEGRNLPFVVGKISGEEITMVPPTHSPLSILQGRIAGIQVTHPSGEPGTGVSIQLRSPTGMFGQSSPLFVVDDVILGTDEMLDIESMDIESIEVIKGAAAASLYGSEASAGVIHIRTNRGASLDIGKAQFQVSSELGSSMLPNNRIPLAKHHAWLINKGDEYVDANGVTVMPRDYIDMAGNRVKRSGRVLDPRGIMDNPYRGPMHDNIGNLFQPGRYMSSTFSVTQKFPNSNYHISLTMRDNSGALKNNRGQQIYSGRINLDHSFSNRIRMSMSAFHSASDAERMSDSQTFRDLYYYDPDINLGAKDENGEYVQFPDPEVARQNPVWIQGTRENWDQRERTLANVTLRTHLTDWLRGEGKLSYDRSTIRTQTYVPKGIPTGPFDANPTSGQLALASSDRMAQNGSLTFTMGRQFGKLNPRLTVGGTFARNDFLRISGDGRQLAVKGLKNLGLAMTTQSLTSTITETRSNSMLLDFAADYDNRLIGSFIVRRDGGSQFGPNRRWHSYYAARGAYQMARESWWPFKETLPEFKPRFAFGTAGGRPRFDHQYETWAVSVTGTTPSFSRGTAGNPELTPENTREWELGVDFRLFRRHEFQFTYATQNTDGLIIQYFGPAALGYLAQWANVGGQSGHTYELEYSTQLLRRRNFAWNLSMVADRSRSELSRWDGDGYITGLYHYTEGSSLYSMWGRRILTKKDQLLSKARVPAEFHNQFDVNDDGYLVWVGEGNTWRDGIAKGLWDSTTSINGIAYGWGLPIVERDESGTIAVMQIGDSQPKLGYGVTNNFRYKQFSLNILLRGQVGGHVYNGSKQTLYNDLRHGDLDQSGKPEERKKPLNYYRGNTGIYQSGGFNTHFVEDASFLKIQSVAVRYTLRQRQLVKLFGGYAPQSLALGLNGRNLYTLTNYTSWDPDIGLVRGRQEFVSAYPKMRTWTATMNVTF